DDPGHELEGRDRGQVPEQHEGLVEGGSDVVGAGPAAVDLRVRADDVVVRKHVAETERFDSLAIRAHGADVAAELGLREHDTDSHERPPASSNGGLASGDGSSARPPEQPYAHRAGPL